MNKNTGFNFELKLDAKKETIEKSLDKIIPFVKKQKPNEKYKLEDYVYYSEETNEWILIDVMEAIRKQAEEQQNKK